MIDPNRVRIRSLAAMLQGQAAGDPLQSLGYQAQTGALRDMLRDEGDADAGRGAALGLAPGMALAAGAKARSQSLVSGLRGAAGAAESQQASAQGRLIDVLGLEASMDAEERRRRDAKRAGMLSTITGLASAGLGFALGGPVGASAGYGVGRQVGR